MEVESSTDAQQQQEKSDENVNENEKIRAEEATTISEAGESIENAQPAQPQTKKKLQLGIHHSFFIPYPGF